MDNIAREARQRRRNIINQRRATRGRHDSRVVNQTVNPRQNRQNTNTARQHNPTRAARSNPELRWTVENTTSTSSPVTETILNFGEPTQICKNCGALFWYEERKRKQRPATEPEFPLCCQYGQVKVPLLNAPPYVLQKLLDLTRGGECREFRDKIRMYNTIFAFTSMGGKIDRTINNGTAPYAFRLSGQNYHLMGSLVPPNGKPPKFLQLYIYDTENELQNRMSALGSTESSTSTGLNEDLVKELLKMLDENNELVKVLRMARDCFKEDELIPVRLKILGKRSRDTREDNLPSASEIAALIVGDIEDTIGYRDIVVEHKMGGIQQIKESNPKFMAMQYPLLFPYGEDGYIEENKCREGSCRPNKKRKCNTMCEYYAFRVQQRREENSALLRGGRLFLQYLVDAYTCIEAERLRFLRYNQKLLRTELYAGLTEAIGKGDTDATLLGRRFILPSTFTGGPQYKMQNYQDAMAICRVYGNPDLFITFTANTKWAEVQSMLNEIPDQKIEERPDIIVRVFKMKLDALMKDLIEGERFGKVNPGMVKPKTKISYV